MRRELTACLRSGRAPRVPRERTQGRNKSFVGAAIMISERPAEIADRAVPGHWEGDLILGLGSSAIGPLVERNTRFTMLLHLPRMDGYHHRPSIKNGPPLAGHGAEAVRKAIARSMGKLFEQCASHERTFPEADGRSRRRLLDKPCRQRLDQYSDGELLLFIEPRAQEAMVRSRSVIVIS